MSQAESINLRGNGLQTVEANAFRGIYATYGKGALQIEYIITIIII